MTGYADYLFLLTPSEDVRLEIGRYKRASARLIGDQKGVNTPAYVNVVQVERQKPFFAESTTQRMEQGFNALPPVQLHIDGFKYFTHLHDKHSIYAAIRTTSQVEDWLARLKKIIGVKKVVVPHIVVVRDIKTESFNALWPHFRHKQLVMPFWTRELKIVKRETFGSIPRWENYKTFGFGGKVVSTARQTR